MFNIKLFAWVEERVGNVFSDLHRGARPVENMEKLPVHNKESRLVDIFLHLLLFGTTLMAS